MNTFARPFLALLLCLGFLPNSSAVPIRWSLQTRDPQTGKTNITYEQVDSSRIGVVAVDIWNYHWCKTATMRVDAFVPLWVLVAFTYIVEQTWSVRRGGGARRGAIG